MGVRSLIIGGGADFGIAATEVITFDENGNCVGANFMDYLLPAAVETKLEPFETVTPSPHPPVGAKRVGQSATVGRRWIELSTHDKPDFFRLG